MGRQRVVSQLSEARRVVVRRACLRAMQRGACAATDQ